MPIPNHLAPGETDDDVQNLVNGALSMDSHSFCSHFILDRIPWIFPDRAAYIDWKQSLALGLGVDPYALCIVGSAATGVSLSPSNGLRLFTAESDIDVAVVSEHHFDLAWRTIRGFGDPEAVLTRRQQKGFHQHRRGLLFDGCIATDKILRLLPYGADWSDALSRSSRGDPLVGHSVKARVYRDFDALRAYQLRSAAHAKEQLE